MARSNARPRERAGSAATPRRAVRRGAFPELDRLIHERVRLGIVSALAAEDRLTFRELKTLLRLTDGNLSVHARRLEEAGYLSCVKSFEGRMPRTEYRLTAEGRRAFERYLGHLDAIVRKGRG